MAHAVETMAYAHQVGANHEAYQTPWHGLGVPVSNDLTPAQMQKAAGLDWRVERYPAFISVQCEKTETNKDGFDIIPTGQTALVRSSDRRILTNVSEGWQETQNDEAFEFFSEFCLNGGLEMNTAGSLHGGKIVWVLAKTRDSFELFEGRDVVDSYLLFTLPHVYGKSIDVRFTPVRVVCNNTLTMALANKGDLQVRVTHRRKFDAEMVKQALGMANVRLTEYHEAAKFLASRKFEMSDLLDYYREVFPSMSAKDETKLSRPANSALTSLETQPGAEFGKGTWWQAFNSVTFATDHLVGHGQESRLDAAWYGLNRQKKLKALELAAEFANKSPSNVIVQEAPVAPKKPKKKASKATEKVAEVV